MTPIRISRLKTLDGESTFRLYWEELGSARSIGKVIKRLPVNPNTNRPYTQMGVWFTIYEWAFNNTEKSYEIFTNCMRDEGKYHTIEEWEQFVQTKIFIYMKKSKPRFLRCISRLGKKNLIF